MTDARQPRAEAYRDAARERALDAIALLEAGRHGAAIWVAGVAVECIFRAYCRRRTSRLDTGHDLKALYRQSRFSDRIAPRHLERITVAVGEIAGCWRHRFRYDPERVVARAVGVRSDRQIERVATRLVESAAQIVNQGVARW
jgi:hypothetical protein